MLRQRRQLVATGCFNAKKLSLQTGISTKQSSIATICCNKINFSSQLAILTTPFWWRQIGISTGSIFVAKACCDTEDFLLRLVLATS
jgi:hypothetical protein